MKRTFSLFFIFVFPVIGLFQNSVSAQPPVKSDEIAGSYAYSTGFLGGIYTLTGDGKFEYSSFSDCCDPVWRESGSYNLKDNLLHLTIARKTLENYNLLDPKEATEAYKKLYNAAREVKADEIKTEYDLHVIKWGERIYLIEGERLNEFAGAVNLGFEPRMNIIIRDRLSLRVFLRSGDETKLVNGYPVLPGSFNSYLSSLPIKAIIKKIGLQGDENIYTINKGNLDGLKVGMYLTKEKAERNRYAILRVESVEQHSAKLKSNSSLTLLDYKIGSFITTKTIKRKS